MINIMLIEENKHVSTAPDLRREHPYKLSNITEYNAQKSSCPTYKSRSLVSLLIVVVE